MAEKDNVNPVAKIEDLPDPKIAEQQAGQDLAQAGDPSVTLESLRDMIREEMQSIKDTRLGKSETRLDNLESAVGKYEALQAQGLSKDQALNQMQGDKELGDIKSQLASLLEGKVPDVSTGVGAQGWKERRASILSDSKIDGSDPRFVEFMKQKFTSHDDMNEKLFKSAEEWSFADETKPKPSAGTVAQIIPEVTAGDGTYTNEKYAEDMLAASGDKTKIKAIKAKARADGVDVDNIGFV